MSWNLYDLVFDYYPRNMWVSHVRAFMYCNMTPSHLEIAMQGQVAKDPSMVYTISPKNYTADAKKYQLQYCKVDNFGVAINNYGSQLDIVSSRLGPAWISYLKNNQWYYNQLRATKIARLLKLLPGVKNIYITGSSVLELSTTSSDIDFIIQAQTGQAWIARFWVKTVLKLFRLDVHDIVLESKIGFLRLMKKVRLLSLEKYRAEVAKIEESIWKKKQKGGLIDVGLFYEKYEDVESIFPRETRNFYIWSSLKLVNLDEKTNILSLYGGETFYWQKSSNLTNITLLIVKYTLRAVSFVLYPLLILQFHYYTNRRNKYIYFILTKAIICYFPVIFKPKSVLEYQLKK
jgi:predicted nucleotidyltransferase